MLIRAYQDQLKYHDQKKRYDTENFFEKWLSAEDEGDNLRDQNRKLKDEIAILKQQIIKNKR